MVVDSRDGARHGAVLGAHGLRESHLEELLLESCDVGVAVGVGDEASGELAHDGAHVGVFGADVSRQVGILGARAELCLILHEAAVGGHVGEEHEGQATAEEACATAHLEALVAEDIPCEAYARREDDVGRRPFAGVDVAEVAVGVVVVESLDGGVGKEVAIVEEEAVDAQAVGELEAVGDVPVVLGIYAELVVAHACCRLRLAVVAVGETHDLGRGSVEEVVHRAVAVVARAVSHVLVVVHLVFIAYAGHDLVGAEIVVDIVLDVQRCGVHGVVPGEELIAEAHVLDVVARAVLNVDEGELAGV